MDFEPEIKNILQANQQEYTNICTKFPPEKLKSAYNYLLSELHTSIVDDDLQKFKKVQSFLTVFIDIRSQSDIQEWSAQINNPLQSTNLIILCCKFTRKNLLKNLITKNNGTFLRKLSICMNGASLLPSDRDGEQHNAFYYAIRNGNIALLQMLLEHWPEKYFTQATTNVNQEIDEILAGALNELIIRNVDISEEMLNFVCKNLFNLRFKFEKLENRTDLRKNYQNGDAQAQLKQRIDLALDNITVITEEYSDGKKFDEKLLFLCRSLAKDIHVLKNKLKSTYAVLPWEEIEFIIVAFVLSQTKREEINIFYLMTLRGNTFFEHLKYFAEQLKLSSGQLINNNYKPSALPRIHRHLLVSKLKNGDSQYSKLIDDFEQIKDAYSFTKIIDSIDFALAVDPADPNAPLIGIRALQTIGEFVKNTLESPNLSTESTELFLMTMPKNIHSIFITLRNSFSHVEGLIKRNEMLQMANESNGIFIKSIQDDLKSIKNAIKQIIHQRESALICKILTEITEAETIDDVKNIAEMVDFVNFDFGKFIKNKKEMLKDFDIKQIVKEFESVTRINSNTRNLLGQIKDMVASVKNELSLHENEYLEARAVLQDLTISKDVLTHYHLKVLKTKTKNTLRNIEFTQKSEYLAAIGWKMLEVIDNQPSQLAATSTRCNNSEGFRNLIREIKNEKRMTELTFKVLTFAGVTTNDCKTIEDLKYDLCLNDLEELQVQNENLKDGYETVFTNNFERLDHLLRQLAIKRIKTENPEENAEQRGRLIKALEVLFVDIISVMKWRNDKFVFVKNPAYLDINYPILSGVQLRNYLVHQDPLFEILPFNTSIFTICNAETLLAKFTATKFDPIHKFMIATNLNSNTVDIRLHYNNIHQIIQSQQKCFKIVESAEANEIDGCLRDGSDLWARDLKLQTCLHHATRNATLETIKCLVSHHQLSPNTRDFRGHTPFQLSVKHGRKEIAEFFLKNCGIVFNPDTNDNPFNNSLMHLAIESNSVEMIEFLVNNKLDSKSHYQAVEFIDYAIMRQNQTASIFLMKWQKPNVNAKPTTGYSYLHMAAQNGLNELVEYLFENGADVNSKHNQSTLHAAVEHCHFETVKLLLEKGANPNNEVEFAAGATPIFFACEGGDEKIIEILLEYGADPTKTEKMYQHSPLHMLCLSGHINGVKILLNNHKIDVNASTIDSSRPIHFAAERGHLNIVKLLVEHKAPVNNKTIQNITPLHYAAFHGHFEIVKFLVENGAKTNCVAKPSIFLKSLPLDALRYAAFNGRLDIVEFLVSKAGNVSSEIYTHAAELAASNGHTKIVSYFLEKDIKITKKLLEAAAKDFSIFQLLLNKKVNVKMLISNGFTLLHFAAQHGNIGIVKRLIELGAKVDSEIDNYVLKSPLAFAIKGNHIAVVKLLIKFGALIRKNEQSVKLLTLTLHEQNPIILEILLKEQVFIQSDLKTCLKIAVKSDYIDMIDIILKYVSLSQDVKFGEELLQISVSNGYKTITKMLLSKGVNVNNNICTNYDLTFLQIATMTDSFEMVKCLIEHGADVNAKNLMGLDALHFAVRNCNSEIVNLLIHHGADVLAEEIEGRMPIEFAVANDDIKTAAVLIATKKININRKVTGSFSLLHIAAQKGNLRMTKFLCEKGADMHIKNDYGSKPIHHAARDAHIPVVEFYLDRGLDVNELAGPGKTLIHFAALSKDTHEMITYLYSKGADLNRKSYEGETPLDVAISKDHPNIVKVLVDLGAVSSAYIQNEAAATDAKISKYLQCVRKLFEAVKSNNFIEIERLVNNSGAQVNAKNEKNMTILHFAVWKGYAQSINTILKCGGDVNIIGKDNSTALHYAAKFNHFEIVLTLLAHGAIYNGKTSHNKTPLSLAGDKKVQNLLKLIDRCFSLAQSNDTTIIKKLNGIKDFEMLKAIVRAKNASKETLMFIAMQNPVVFIFDLQQIGQTVNGHQFNRTLQQLELREQHGQAIDFLRNVRKKREDLFGEQCPGNSNIDLLIMTKTYKQQKYNEALTQCNKLLSTFTEIFGNNSRLALETQSRKALIYHRLGRDLEALEIIQPTIKKIETYFGKNVDFYLDAQLNLGLVCQNLQRFEAALKAYTICYAEWKKLFGESHLCTLLAQNNMAVIYTFLGKFDEALKLHEKVYKYRLKILGANHSDTLRTMHNIGTIYFDQKKWHQALEIYEKVWEAQKRSLGTNHVDSLRTQLHIGKILHSQSQNVMALRYFNEALPKLCQILGDDHLEILMEQKILENLKTSLKLSGQNFFNEFLVINKVQLNKAIIAKNVNEIQSLITHGADVNWKDSTGFTPLHFAVQANDKNIIKLLLEKSADPIQTSDKGNTPLHTAATMGHTETAKILVKHVKKNSVLNFYGFLNGQTKNGKMTALHVAAKSGFVDIVKLLLKNGAIIDLVDAKGLKPVDLSKNEEVTRLLKCCGEILSEAEKNGIQIIDKLKVIRSKENQEFLKIISSAKNIQNKGLFDLLIKDSMNQFEVFQVMMELEKIVKET